MPRHNLVRAFNKRVLNPVMLTLAGRRHWYAARVEHVGRRSGRRYSTPVVAVPVPAGFAIPLPYGSDVDWARNLEAADGGVLVVGGQRYAVNSVRVVPTPDIESVLPSRWRRLSRLSRDNGQWLLVHREQPGPTKAAGSARRGSGT
jgi:deazaflavin-dependent oxidoreductase (nitroreductase family)